MSATISSNARRRTSARTRGAVAAQAGKAAAAASTAALASTAVPSATWAMTSVVAGLRTAKVPPATIVGSIVCVIRSP